MGHSRVKIPMMPKGVEHLPLFVRTYFEIRVKIPMMPKGVEHKSHLVIDIGCFYGVKIPMMPKGVEHFNAPDDGYASLG